MLTNHKVFLALLLFICAPLSLPAQEAPPLKNLIDLFQRNKHYTLGVLEAMPEEKLGYSVTDSTYTFRKHFLHISDNISSFYSKWIKEEESPFDFNPDEELSKEEVKSIVNNVFDYMINDLMTAEPDEMTAVVEYLPGYDLPKYQILALIRDHITHHRAQAVVYLQLNGLKPPGYIGL